MATTAAGTPYVETSDLVANYPGVSLALANHIDDLPAAVLQVVSATYSTNTTTTSTAYVTTGLEATITPSSTSNKILVLAYTCGFVSRTAGAESASFTLLRGATEIAGAPSGMVRFDVMPQSSSISIAYLDSPSTTSATTYKMAMRVGGASTTIGAQKDGALAAIQLLEVSP